MAESPLEFEPCAHRVYPLSSVGEEGKVAALHFLGLGFVWLLLPGLEFVWLLLVDG